MSPHTRTQHNGNAHSNWVNFPAYALGVLLACLGMGSASGQTPLPQSFLTCIQTLNGTCVLQPGTYAIDGSANFPAAKIGASGVTVQGVQNGGSYPTLQRTGNVASLMTIGSGVNATIEYLNFDGNRYGVTGLSCLGANAPYTDLNLSGAGTVTVQYVNFKNAPGSAAAIDGNYANGHNSVIQYSTFAEGGPSQASRSTGLFLYGTLSYAENNYIYYSGTAGIAVWGYGNWIYGNGLALNRYEEPDNAPGGQLFINNSSNYAYAGGNIIQGDSWQTNGTPVNGCSTVALSPPDGIEVWGNNAEFFDNGIYSHHGTMRSIPGGFGMLIAPSNSVAGVYISDTDPWNPNDTIKDIFYNSGGGIFVGPYASSYLTFQQVHIDGNGGWGVSLDNVNTATFSAGVCMYNNSSGNIQAVNSTNITYPTNYGSCSN